MKTYNYVNSDNVKLLDDILLFTQCDAEIYILEYNSDADVLVAYGEYILQICVNANTQVSEDEVNLLRCYTSDYEEVLEQPILSDSVKYKILGLIEDFKYIPFVCCSDEDGAYIISMNGIS